MLRPALILVLCVAVAAALDTPLTLITQQGNRVVVVDPAFGSISLFEVNQSTANRVSGLRQPQANFIADLDMRLKSYFDERDGVAYQWLRIGHDTKPTYGEMFNLLPDKPTKGEAKAGKRALRWRAARAEDAAWKGEPAYDGVVRAAITASGQHVMLGIPSLHVLMLYRVDGEAVKLVAVRNFGPDLFVTGLNTAPDPKQLMQQVLARAKNKEDEERIRAAFGLDEDSQPAEAAPAAPEALAAAEEPPTPKSDLWVGAGDRESFFVTDAANARIMLYRADKELLLASVRDLRIDLVVPGLVGGSLKSDPAGERLLEDFFAQRKKEVAEFGLPTEREEVLALIGQRKAQGKPSPFEALSSPATGLAMANFADRRVLLTFDGKGAAALKLVAARDYTLDVAVTLLDQEIQDRAAARGLLTTVQRLASDGKRATALLSLKQALNLDPRLHKDAEKQFKSTFAKDADQQARYQAMLDEAAKRAEELAKQAEARRQAAEDKRKAGK